MVVFLRHCALYKFTFYLHTYGFACRWNPWGRIWWNPTQNSRDFAMPSKSWKSMQYLQNFMIALKLLYWRTSGWSVAVLTTWCQTSLSLAFRQAVWISKFKDWRSSSIVLSQVVLGRPRGLLQSAGGLSAVMGKFNSRGLLLMLKNKFLCAVSRWSLRPYITCDVILPADRFRDRQTNGVVHYSSDKMNSQPASLMHRWVRPNINYTRLPITSPNCQRQLVRDLLETRPTSPQQVVVMEFGKRHDTTDTTDFCPRQLVTDLSFMLRTCYAFAMGKSPTCYRLATGKLV